MIISDDGVYVLFATGMAFGLVLGGIIGHSVTKEEEQKKWKKRKPVTFCPKCDERMRAIAAHDNEDD
jgi:hypothetical protein